MNSLQITKEVWPEVTNIPHFVVSLHYEGCKLSHDDIYFDNLTELPRLLENLEKSRKGKVLLDGGSLFKCLVETTLTGGLELRFTAHSGSDFPGEMTLEGRFLVHGEDSSRIIESLVSLLQHGTPFAT